MGLSITAMLASIASDIVIAGNLPQAKELTWFQQFSMMNSMFVFLALIESVVVLHFFYSRADNMVPKVRGCHLFCLAPFDAILMTMTATLFVQWYTHIKEWRILRKAQRRSSEMVTEAEDSIRRKTVNFKENVFSTNPSDENSDDNDDVESEAVDQFVQNELPTRRPSAKERSRQLLARSSLGALGVSIRMDADDFLNGEEVVNNLKWKEYALLVDDVSRFWFPCIYFISCAIVLAKAK
jgi:hypothetical protein